MVERYKIYSNPDEDPALIEELELFEEINSYHLGYVIGPHINAGGRISNSSLGSTLLSTKDKEEAKDIAQKDNIYFDKFVNLCEVACIKAN